MKQAQNFIRCLVVVLLAGCTSVCPLLAQIAQFLPGDQFSSSLISSLCQDRQGSMWIATDYGLNRFDGFNYQTFLHDEADSTSLNCNSAVSLLCDSKGRLWVGTTRGLDRFNPATDNFTHYPFPNGEQPRVTRVLERGDGTLLVGTAGYGCFKLRDGDKLEEYNIEEAYDYVGRLFEDSQNRLWMSGFDDRIIMHDMGQIHTFHYSVGEPRSFVEFDGQLLVVCQHGILTLKEGELRKADIDMSAVEGKDIVFTHAQKDLHGNLYIGTRGQGLFCVKAFPECRLQPMDITAMGIDASTAKITTMTIDRQGNLWAGCERKGLLLLRQLPVQFANWSFEAQGIRLGSTISSVCEGDGGIFWATVQGVGVYGFNRQGRVVARPKAPDAVEFIFRDKQRRYWIGTDDGLFSYDPLSGQSQLKVTFNCDKFNDMTSDNEGNIYISTFSRGFCVYNPQRGSLKNYSTFDVDSVNGRLCNNWVMGMSTDRQGLLWLATSSGVACFDPATGSFRSQGWDQQLNGTVCFDVCELRDGNIAIATDQGLFLYDRASRQTFLFPGSEALRNKVVDYVVQANDGDIWCSTSQGIWQYSQESHSFLTHTHGYGLSKKEYIYGVGMHTDDDMIFFGHNDGLTVFQPKDIRESRPTLEPLQLTAFRVADQYVKAGTIINDVEVTGDDVSQSDHFTLSYLDHTVTLAFSQFNFDIPSSIMLEYRVNDGNWIHNAEGKNEITLGHLQPGTYHIDARAQQAGEYSPVKQVTITIRAPWYRSTLAYIIYLLVALGVLAWVLIGMNRRANRQLNEEKMKFLINATHDIRSPLTIIIAALKKLKEQLPTLGGEKPSGRSSGKGPAGALDTIDRNAHRILDLVNQILDVRKIDKQQMHLHCQATEMVSFVSAVCKMFDFNAQERNIKFQFLHDGIDRLEAWVDPTQFDKVITNLLSNAFKYSYDEGEITVRLSTDAERKSFSLAVSDNGVGLDGDSLKHIFDRFYQGSNSRRMNIDGTGIGLNLCKMIIDMHHGTISAKNRTGGQGSEFVITLPLGNSHLKPEEMETKVESTSVRTVVAKPQSGTTHHRVLIVDDDQEIGNFISSELGHYYRFTVCSNGKEALKELLQNEYDLVVSDVMMPEMDGFTMLRMIKTNMNLSHLPVVMLTSKDDVANRLEGLERGADAFLAKPFDMKELHLTIENLIQGRRHLKGKFSGAQQQTDKLEQPEVKGNDELLMERIMKVVNKNLADSDFNVEMLCHEVGISRTQLHRKMKELTGLSTSEFIRNIRLEQAARLLKEQKVNITQVAYTVGFSNLAHFSTIFRRHFGVSPSEYAEK